jgi:prophage DNA circulation protein
MNKAELNEAVGLAQQVLTALLATPSTSTGQTGAQLRYLCGQLAVNAAAELNVDTGPAQFFADLAACFEQARVAGATYAPMDAVRATAEAFTPQMPAGVAVQNFSVRMALAELAQILSATTFTSRQDVDTALDAINASFDLAETVAADSLDNVAYRALIGLHAAVANDLSTRTRPLPRLVTYTFPQRMPVLWIAQRLYQDPSRAAELVAENKPVHPLFMPESGLALSS